MTVNLSPVGGAAQQFFDNNGAILSGGKIYTYAAGTTTPQPTYTSSSGGTAHTNPIILDSAGRVPAGEIWLTDNVAYKFAIETSAGLLLGTYDDISGINAVNITASSIAYSPPFTGGVATNVANKLSQSITLDDFGGVGDGVTNDTAAVQAADAWGAHTYSPEGIYDTTLVSSTIEGPYWGSGQIRDSLNNKRAPWFSAVMSAPSPQGNDTSIETAFNGDLSHVQIAMEHRITGTATLGQPATGYEYTPEAYPFYGYLYNASGWNQDTGGNGGRTGAAFFRVKVDNYGQGDLVCYNGTAFVTGQRAGATSFLANPAAVLFNGDITAGANGVYLNPYETYVRDNGYDVAAIGSVLNMDRSNHTGALDCWWAGIRVQSKGSAACDAIMSAVGKFDNGIDFTPANLDFGANQAAISLRQNQRIYFNNASSNDNYTTSYNGWWLEYRSSLGGIQFVVNGSSTFQLTASQTTVAGVRLTATDRVQFTALGNYANDAAAAAAGVNINELYRNGSVVQIRVT